LPADQAFCALDSARMCQNARMRAGQSANSHHSGPESPFFSAVDRPLLSLSSSFFQDRGRAYDGGARRRWTAVRMAALGSQRPSAVQHRPPIRDSLNVGSRHCNAATSRLQRMAAFRPNRSDRNASPLPNSGLRLHSGPVAMLSLIWARIHASCRTNQGVR